MSAANLKFIVNDDDLKLTGLTAIDVAKKYCRCKNSFTHESEISGVRFKFEEYTENKNDDNEVEASCEGCHNWKRGKRWGFRCTVCVRNPSIVDNYSVSAA